MTHTLTYHIHDVAPYINWIYFFHAWGFPPSFATAARIHGCDACRASWLAGFPETERTRATEAMQLLKDAQRMLTHLDEDFRTYALFGLYPAFAEEADNLVLSDPGHVERRALRLPMLRQQHATTAPDLCLTDFVRPAAQGIPDTVGVFATTVPPEMEHLYEHGAYADPFKHLLAQTLADLHPRFVRFPGGCVAHGNGIDNIYRWKNSVGPLEARKPMGNLWGYHQTLGLGYFEYFQFCEDIGAEPLPVLAAGVPCQNSACIPGKPLSGGQQGGIPMEEMDAYVQDILDLIEYANGDPKKNKWAKMRAEAGHPKPFNLKYIGIGNEDLITPIFEERFEMIFKAIKEKYPEITVIGTVGPFYEGTDYEAGWEFATRLNVPMVDEHYYNTPGWFINNQDYYDRYDRTKPKVYLGEYAAHLPGRPNNIETALAEALYLTSVERNGDIVSMTSYAPLLAKEGHTQWNPDLIYFNNREVKPTVGYYTQQLYGQNSGDTYLPADRKIDNPRQDVQKRIGTSVVRDSKTGDWIVKLVNLLPVPVKAKVEGLAQTENGKAVLQVLSGKPTDKNARPVKKDVSVTELSQYEMPAYSLSVIRIKADETTK